MSFVSDSPIWASVLGLHFKLCLQEIFHFSPRKILGDGLWLSIYRQQSTQAEYSLFSYLSYNKWVIPTNGNDTISRQDKKADLIIREKIDAVLEGVAKLLGEEILSYSAEEDHTKALNSSEYFDWTIDGE